MVVVKLDSKGEIENLRLLEWAAIKKGPNRRCRSTVKNGENKL